MVLTRCSVPICRLVAESTGSAAGSSVAGRGCRCVEDNLRMRCQKCMLRGSNMSASAGHDGWVMQVDIRGWRGSQGRLLQGGAMARGRPMRTAL